MIDLRNIKKYRNIYCTVGLMCLTTIGLSEITKPSYALLTSTTQMTISFKAADSFPQKDIPAPLQELAPLQTPEQPSGGVTEEQQGKTEGESEQTAVQPEENLESSGDQILGAQNDKDSTASSAVDSPVQPVQMENEETEPTSVELGKETESAINQTTTEGAIN